ncbi:MAG: glycosyltransferase [Acidobacteria bacterium]|nr:glycosyltransferase [Acidobacteriota bacterium]
MNLIRCVVPTLNSGSTLEMTLLSLRNQIAQHVDVIVADSGSTDRTLEICSKWGIPVIYVPPGNMYKAVNAGLNESEAQWLAYLNSDDWIYPDCYSKLMELGERTGADVVYGNCHYTDGEGRFVYSFSAAEPEKLLSLFRLRRMGFAQQTCIFRRSAYKTLKGFDENFFFRSDGDFFVRALLSDMVFSKYDGPPVACFRLQEKQFSKSWSGTY